MNDDEAAGAAYDYAPLGNHQQNDFEMVNKQDNDFNIMHYSDDDDVRQDNDDKPAGKGK